MAKTKYYIIGSELKALGHVPATSARFAKSVKKFSPADTVWRLT
jgi:hypothetical protein